MKSQCWQFDAYGAPETLVWREQELPEPGPGQALVKLKAIGMNRADWNYVQGEYFPAEVFPSCLGAEAVGEIIALGEPTESGLTALTQLDLKVGARVGTLSARVNRARMGVYRDIGLYDQAALVPVPETYTDEEGAAFWTALLTMGGAMEMGGFTANSGAGKTVLITAAASGMGMLALKIAKLWGATTIATTRSAQKQKEMSGFADHVILCQDSESLAKEAKRVTNGQGVNLALDPVGAAFYPGLLGAMARSGDIVSYEAITGSQASIGIMDMMMKDLSFHGFTIFRPFSSPQLLSTLVDIGLANAEALRPVVAGSFDLANAPQALDALGRSEHIGKLIIRC
ncbi:MAG: zinc-binding dehydrogenase [Pseudomonadales bacterium]|nr:zinc-binding dehydrogenase [Pseudomonadales bacterium]MCP5213970.1 zinc-binding dehydrogenase [Pseudomonadales bacterium]